MLCQDLIIVMGDFNVKVGEDWMTWRGAMRKFGFGRGNSDNRRQKHVSNPPSCYQYDWNKLFQVGRQ